MQGRKPKPTAIKKLEGNPGKRPLPKREPKLPVVLPDPPADLGEVAAEKWRELSADLARAGVLTSLDLDMLRLYCLNHEMLADAFADVAKNGTSFIGVKGGLVRNPAMVTIGECQARLIKLAAEFGMTPSSRVRVRTENPEPEEELERMLFGAGTKVR